LPEFFRYQYLGDCMKLGSIRWKGIWKRHTADAYRGGRLFLAHFLLTLVIMSAAHEVLKNSKGLAAAVLQAPKPTTKEGKQKDKPNVSGGKQESFDRHLRFPTLVTGPRES
jgi:hypothetical protein